MSAIKVENISKSFGKVKALDNIRKLASPCRDRRPRLSVREKIDTQKANNNPRQIFAKSLSGLFYSVRKIGI